MVDGKPGNDTRNAAGRWTKIILVLSLAMNLFVIALVVGASFGHHRWHRPHSGVSDVGVGLFTEVLTRRDRAALRDAFLAAAPDFREQRRAAQDDFTDLAEALRQDPLDLALVDTLVARHGTRIAERIDLGRRLLSERIGQMSASERADFADRIDARLKRGRRR
ncbi:MAG: periplasmic heavy metal sensor [Albidovulum sp.]|uniref:periplasmic heavy metal sensor n=1 Tax=Albidovulum sp. TaxID=1872424 RepID=UPI003CBB917F